MGTTMNDFFEEREIGEDSVMVKVAIKPMTKEEARQAYPYRPRSKYSESWFGGNNMADDFCLLLNGGAERCVMCQAPTMPKYLHEKVCPDCDGRSQLNGKNPHGV